MGGTARVTNMGLSDRFQAALYDRVTAPIERKWLGDIRRELISGLTGRVLEIGAGTGANFQYYSPQAQVTATEPSLHFFKRALAKLPSAQARIELQEANAHALPFDADAFDAVVATLVFCTIPDPRRALDEIRRVAKDQAPLVLVEHVQAKTSGRRLIQNLWNPCQKVLAGGCNVNRDTEATLRAAGFRIDEVRELPTEMMVLPHLLIRAINTKFVAAS